jgi:hypothetical protein
MSALEDSILMRMQRMKVSRCVLAQLTGIREQDLCPKLKCVLPLSIVEAERIHQVLSDLEKIQDVLRPGDLPVTNTRRLKFLLEKLNDGDMEHFQSPTAKAIAAEMMSAAW